MDHIALKVTDMKRTLHFYQDILGLELRRHSGPNEQGGESAVLQAGQQALDPLNGKTVLPSMSMIPTAFMLSCG
jgi:catechol 2,3-dioxygenase-like lactoylglutathione lyase family enzyme